MDTKNTITREELDEELTKLRSELRETYMMAWSWTYAIYNAFNKHTHQVKQTRPGTGLSIFVTRHPNKQIRKPTL